MYVCVCVDICVPVGIVFVYVCGYVFMLEHISTYETCFLPEHWPRGLGMMMGFTLAVTSLGSVLLPIIPLDFMA